tara:strand:- start:2341 stop:2937 length:597 start_codon:yes stop_codon:yes gene_type:complete
MNKKQTNHFLIGGWAVNKNNPYTKITNTDLPHDVIFRITNIEMADGKVAEFKIFKNDEAITTFLQEGSSILVEAKSLHIEQINNVNMSFGTWEVISEPNLDFLSTDWFIPQPSFNKKVLISSFQKNTDFVLSFNRTSNGCNNGELLIYIDGKPIKNSTTNLKFIENSSLLGSGKLIEVEVKGNCNVNSGFRGNIKIKK